MRVRAEVIYLGEKAKKVKGEATSVIGEPGEHLPPKESLQAATQLFSTHIAVTQLQAEKETKKLASEDTQDPQDNNSESPTKLILPSGASRTSSET